MAGVIIMRQKAPAVSNVQAVLERMDDYSLPPEEYLNRNFGRGSWTYDPCAAVWIVVDDQHAGPGRGFLIVDQELRRSEMRVQLQ